MEKREADTVTERSYCQRVHSLRGVMAVTVFLSHIWFYTGFPFLVPFNKAVTIAVSYFFFCSGYSMMRSAQSKRGYGKQILTRKLPQLLFMAAVAYMFGAFLEAVISLRYPGMGFYLPFGPLKLITSMNWYVYELSAFYLLLFGLLFVLRNKTGWYPYLILLVSAVAFCMLYRAGVVEAWYTSIFGYPFGMICASCRIDHKLRKKKTRVLLLTSGAMLTAFAFGAMLMPGIDKTTVGFSLIRNIGAIGLITVILCILWHLDTTGRFFRITTSYSSELYFCHIPVTTLLGYVCPDPAMYLICALGLTLLGICLMKLFNRHVTGRLFVREA